MVSSINWQNIKDAHQFHTILNSMAEGVVVYDDSGKITEYNPAALKILGMTEDLLKARTSKMWEFVNEEYEVIAPDDHPSIIANKTGEIQHKTIGLYHTDGRMRWLSVTAVPIFEKKAKEPSQVLATFIDITDEKRYKEELIEARKGIQLKEEELRVVLDSIPVMIGHWNKELINIHINKAFAEFFEKNVEEVIGSHVRELLGPERFEMNRPLIEKVLKGESPTFERLIEVSEGRTRNMIAKYIPEIVNREVVGFFLVASDVTQLKRSEAKFKNLLELSPDSTIIINEEGNILLANKQTEILFGYSRDYLIGKPFLKLLPDRYKKIFLDSFHEFVRSPTRITIGDKFEIHALRKNESEFPFEVSIGPLQTEEEILISCVIRDVSAHLKEVQEKDELLKTEFKARKAAEEASTMRDEMMAVVSHDLRNPLTNIAGHIDLLIKQRKDDVVLKSRLERMRRSTVMMLSMIKDLLDVYKFEKGHFDIEARRKEQDVKSFLEEVYEEQVLNAQNKSIELVLDIDLNLNLISVDVDMLNRVFQNLISNAMKFTPSGGKIILKGQQANNFVIFSVSDNGPGISKKHIPRLFDRFFQIKETAHLGSGLGLPICKAIVEAHGGHIWVESEIGKGTKFFFSIPVSKHTDTFITH